MARPCSDCRAPSRASLPHWNFSRPLPFFAFRIRSTTLCLRIWGTSRLLILLPFLVSPAERFTRVNVLHKRRNIIIVRRVAQKRRYTTNRTVRSLPLHQLGRQTTSTSRRTPPTPTSIPIGTPSTHAPHTPDISMPKTARVPLPRREGAILTLPRPSHAPRPVSVAHTPTPTRTPLIA